MRRIHLKERTGLVVVITGNGKGKTTAALGIALRACGHGMRTTIIQFMKGPQFTGEWDAAKALCNNLEILPVGVGFCRCKEGSPAFEKHRRSALQGLALAREKLEASQCDVLILDEIHNVIEIKLLQLEELLDLMRCRPAGVHLVLTGRGARAELVELADTASEVVCLKHAYDKGIPPQPGIDY